MKIPFSGNVNGRLVEKRFEGQVFYYVYDQQQGKGYGVGYGFLSLKGRIDQPMIRPFINGSLANYSHGLRWDMVFETAIEARKHKDILEAMYLEGFSSRPFIKLEMLKQIRGELIEIENILNLIFGDDDRFSHVSFSDVSANGIQVYVCGKPDSHNYGYCATLEYNLSNKLNVIGDFLKYIKSKAPN